MRLPFRVDLPELFAAVVIMLVASFSVSLASSRDPKAVAAFRADHSCPSTGKVSGHSPNYVVDHTYPLCAGGADTPENMMWMEREASYAKDRIERELCACKSRRGGGDAP